MKKLYKVLIGGRSCNGGSMEWSLPKKKGREWIPGQWHVFDGELRLCHFGLHLTTSPFSWYKNDCVFYEAEATEIGEGDEKKCVARKVRLLKESPFPDWFKDCKLFIKSLSKIAWFKNDGRPLKEWKLFETREAAVDAAWDAVGAAAVAAAGAAASDAARNAAGAAAGAAAWDAAGDAAVDAAWAAASDAARNAASDAARAAARAAAWAAAWDAVGAAARDAEGAAALEVRILVCKGLKLDKKHIEHSKKRMEVWRKGYGLLCDVNGILYVYKAI